MDLHRTLHEDAMEDGGIEWIPEDRFWREVVKRLKKGQSVTVLLDSVRITYHPGDVQKVIALVGAGKALLGQDTSTSVSQTDSPSTPQH